MSGLYQQPSRDLRGLHRIQEDYAKALDVSRRARIVRMAGSAGALRRSACGRAAGPALRKQP